MRVRMLVTADGSRDGIRMETHKKGQVINLPLSLANTFIVAEWGVNADTESIAQPTENKLTPPRSTKKTTRKKV